MFNGIIFHKGKVSFLKKYKESLNIGIKSSIKINKNEIGSSVCCNGVCLTLTSIYKKRLNFYVSSETLKRSNFKKIKINDEINIEKSLKYGQNISGHFIQGHVDTTGTVEKIKIKNKSWIINIKLKSDYMNFLVEKASIAINGVSLTIAKIYKNSFDVSIIPHTLKLTNLISLKKNSVLNIEIDIFSKYLKKYYE